MLFESRVIDFDVYVSSMGVYADPEVLYKINGL